MAVALAPAAQNTEPLSQCIARSTTMGAGPPLAELRLSTVAPKRRRAVGVASKALGKSPSMMVALPHPSIRGANTIRLVPEETSTRSAFAVAGFKWNLFSSWLLTGNVLFPLSDSGLRAKVVPALALDYAFGR